MAVRTFLDDYTTAWDQFGLRGPHLLQNPPDQGTRLTWYYFSHTQGSTAGDATSTVGLLKIPPGPFRFLMGQFTNSGWGTSRTLDIGWQAGVQNDGTAITADPDGLVAAKDVSLVLVAPWGFNVATSQVVLNPAGHIGIIATVAGGTIPAAATLKGWILVGRP
jgi:hypothetical protein